MIVKYSRAFPIAAYGINEHIGFEVEIDDSVDIQIALQKLREQAEQSFTTAHPTVVLQKQVEEVDKRTPEEMKAADIADIMSSKTLKELDTFKILKTIDKDYFNAYNTKLKEFLK